MHVPEQQLQMTLSDGFLVALSRQVARSSYAGHAGCWIMLDMHDLAGLKKADI